MDSPRKLCCVSEVAIRLKSEKELWALRREAEAELDAATKRSEINLAARKLMQAKRALIYGPPRRSASDRLANRTGQRAAQQGPR